MSKYQVGDKVKIKDYLDPNGAMVEFMLLDHGGKVRTISKVVSGVGWKGQPLFGYELAEGPDGISTRYVFLDEDIECLVSRAQHETQRIEIPVPGGRLVAETTGGADYPAIHIFFVASGSQVEHGLCFAEVCVEDNPNVIRVGNYFRNCDDVQDIYEYNMWTKEEDDV